MDGFISYNGNSYSVPEGIDGKEIEVRATLEEVSLYREGKLVARHPLLVGKGMRHLAPEHRRNVRLYLKRYEEGTNAAGEFITVERRSLEVLIRGAGDYIEKFIEVDVIFPGIFVHCFHKAVVFQTFLEVFGGLRVLNK
jgi:hypothetical protein